MDKLCCYMGKLHCEITTENLIENEDMKNFLRMVAIYRNCEEKDVEEKEAFGLMIDMIILNVNDIILKQKGERKMMDNGKNEERLKVLFKTLNPNAAIPVRNGAAYDLFIPEDVKIEAGETVKIRLGFACKLPDGYHALINMRSSTWGKWGLCLSNQTGIIDNGYCGESDEWILSVYRPNSFKEFPTLIPAGTRIAQFRLEQDCPELEFEKVDHLTSLSRGGFGSTGD